MSNPIEVHVVLERAHEVPIENLKGIVGDLLEVASKNAHLQVIKSINRSSDLEGKERISVRIIVEGTSGPKGEKLEQQFRAQPVRLFSVDNVVLTGEKYNPKSFIFEPEQRREVREDQKAREDIYQMTIFDFLKLIKDPGGRNE
jgi:hypothetical protein